MFEGFRNFVEKARTFMFPRQTAERIIGGATALSSPMIQAIELWRDMLAGAAPWVTGDVKSLGIEAGIVTDLASVCVSEMETEVSLAPLDELYKQAIRTLGEELQDGLGLGSFIIKPLGPGEPVQYVAADKFIPVKFDGRGRLTDVVFLDTRKQRDNLWYVRAERHTLDGTALTITNKAYRTSDLTSLGWSIPLDSVGDWAQLPEEISYKGVERPAFGYFRVPKKNRIDDSGCAVSLLADPVAGLIRDADEQFGRLIWEMRGGELAVYVDQTALNPKRGLDAHSRRLYVPVAADSGDFFETFAPALRDESLVRGLNEMLRRIEYAAGLSYGDLSNVQEVAKTATEIRASKQRKYQLVRAIEESLKDCLEDLVYALAFYAGQLGRYEFTCTFADSILTDEETEAATMRDDVAAGILRSEKYLERRYGVTPEQMPEWLAGAEAEAE